MQKKVDDLRDSMKMSESEVNDFLESHVVGVLSLSSENDSYGFPIGYGYDRGVESGKVAFFQMLFAPWSKKRDFVETTDEACLTVFETSEDLDSMSVVVKGELVECNGDQMVSMAESFSNKPTFSVLHEAGVPIEEAEITTYGMDINTKEGRRFEMDVE